MENKDLTKIKLHNYRKRQNNQNFTKQRNDSLHFTQIFGNFHAL